MLHSGRVGWRVIFGCILKSHELSHTASVFWGCYAPSSFAVSLGLPVSHSWIGADEAWFWECYTCQHPVAPATPSPGSHECSSWTRVPVQSTRSYYTAALLSALASCARANSIQACHAGVPVSAWTHAGLLGWWSTACRWTSTMPSFIVNLSTGCTTGLRTIGDRLFPSQRQKSGTICRERDVVTKIVIL